MAPLFFMLGLARSESAKRMRDIETIGEPRWIRTIDLLIKSQLLYQLSYGPDARLLRQNRPKEKPLFDSAAIAELPKGVGP